MRTRLVLSLLCVVSALSASAQTTKSGFFKTSDGVRIHYLDAGSGRPIVFIPGWTMPAWIWQKQIDEFAKKNRVVAVDPRSQGESDKPPYGHLLETRARDYKELVDHLGLKQPVLVGWSLACGELVKYAEQFGTDNIAGLVLVDGFLRQTRRDVHSPVRIYEPAAAGSPKASQRLCSKHVQKATTGRIPETVGRRLNAGSGRHGGGAYLQHDCRAELLRRPGENKSTSFVCVPA